MDKFKLQWKIFSYLLVFCAFLLVILWAFQVVFLNDMYKAVRKTEMEQAIYLIEKNIDNPELEEIIYELEINKEIIVRPTRVFSAPPLPIPEIHNRRQPEAITRVKEFFLEDGEKISLTFFAIITPVKATVSTLQMQLYIISLIMALLATVLAIIISKHISNPIEQINLSAKALAKGDYDIRFHAKGFLEIEELSDTLNTAAEELSKVEKLRRELLANISHDLRTPLAFIYSYAEMMHDFPEEVTAEQSQIIMDETKRLASLVDDMLSISQLESGALELKQTNFNLTESLRNSLKRIKELLKNEKYRLDFIFSEDVTVWADELKITQAFYNLLLNAITYCGDDKTVIIRQVIEEDKVRIKLEDMGEGIAESDLPYIWERYYKVEKAHTRSKIGTGLGLSIVKNIIDMHKGEYGVRSSPGAGSTFWFAIKYSRKQ